MEKPWTLIYAQSILWKHLDSNINDKRHNVYRERHWKIWHYLIYVSGSSGDYAFWIITKTVRVSCSHWWKKCKVRSSGRAQLVCVQWTQCQTHSRLWGKAGTGSTYDLGEHYPPLFVWVNTEAPCKFISITAKLSCTYLFASHWVCQSMSTSNTHWKDTDCLSPYFWHSILVPKPARHICTSVSRVIRTTVLLPCSSYCSPAKQSTALKMVPVLLMHQSDKVTCYWK